MKYFLSKVISEETPLLTPEGNTCFLLSERKFIDPNVTAKFECIDDPPDSDQMELGDYQVVPGSPVISNRLKEVLELFNLTNVQYITAEIKKGTEWFSGYWYLHVYNYLDCINMEKSKYKKFGSFSTLFRELVLQKEKLSALSGPETLLFRLKGSSSSYIWDASVVNAINEAFKIKGFEFIPVGLQ